MLDRLGSVGARVRAMAGALLLALLGSACGSGGSSSSEEPAAPAAPGASVSSIPSWRGALLSASDVALVTRADSDAAAAASNVSALAGPARCDVLVRSLVHGTASPQGEVARNSAALLVPQGAGCAGPFPLLAYARGTSQDRTRTLANPTDKETSLLINMFAAQGVIVVATDYLGYAQSDLPYHPYLHAKSEASSVIDSIRAARAALASAAVATSGKVFLAGYSQGGHAALAAQREIERATGLEFTLTGTGAMSGPYDLALTFAGGAAATLLPSLADESNLGTGDRVRLLLADVVAEIAGAFTGIGAVAAVLADQSVIDFRPLAPVQLCGGARDLTVPFANSTAAATAFGSRGASVDLIDVDQEPAFAPLLPPPGTPASGFGTYHNRIVPPLCFKLVRDRLLTPLR